MKKNLLPILTVISCIISFFCLIKIMDLEQQLTDAEHNLSSGLHNAEWSISNISRTIEEQLKEQGSLLSESHWEYGALDADARTAELKCIVTPKEYQPKRTSATIICNDKEYEMMLENGAYTASVPIPLFEESVVSKVQFTEGDTIRAESLEWYISPRYEFLLDVYANYNGTSNSKFDDKALQWNFNGEVVIQAENKGQKNTVEAIYFLEYVDGKEKKRTKIPLETVSEKENNTNHAEAEAWADSSGNSGTSGISHFFYPFKKTFKVPFGSTLDLYMEVVDQHGLHYRVPFEGISVNKEGNAATSNELYWGGEASIYDEDGQLLYWPQ